MPCIVTELCSLEQRISYSTYRQWGLCKWIYRLCLSDLYLYLTLFTLIMLCLVARRSSFSFSLSWTLWRRFNSLNILTSMWTNCWNATCPTTEITLARILGQQDKLTLVRVSCGSLSCDGSVSCEPVPSPGRKANQVWSSRQKTWPFSCQRSKPLAQIPLLDQGRSIQPKLDTGVEVHNNKVKKKQRYVTNEKPNMYIKVSVDS